jgi:hypothetical protein
VSGLPLVLAGVAGCGDGKDQDNGVDDGEEMDDENKNEEEKFKEELSS